MLALAKQLTASGQYAAAMLSAEVGAPFPGDPGAAEKAILQTWQAAIALTLPPELHPPQWFDTTPGSQIGTALGNWARVSSRPLVIFIDEIDSLGDRTLISVLRQLRSGYPYRPIGFPHSLALVGVRDVRDYKFASGGSGRLNTASPFNIKLESVTLRNFTADEVAELYGQHTAETGQIFTPEAMQRAFDLTQGQPWLVNALARQAVEEIVSERSSAIEIGHIEQAKEILIRRQDNLRLRNARPKPWQKQQEIEKLW